jgi:hypothetical protein
MYRVLHPAPLYFTMELRRAWVLISSPLVLVWFFKSSNLPACRESRCVHSLQRHRIPLILHLEQVPWNLSLSRLH